MASRTSERPPASTVVSGPASWARPESLAACFAASIWDCGELSASRDGTIVSSALSSARLYPGITPRSLRRSGRCRRDRKEHTSELQSRQYLVCRLLLE